MQRSIILQHRRAGKADSALPARQGSRIQFAAFLLTIVAHATLLFCLAREVDAPLPPPQKILHASLRMPTAEPAAPAPSATRAAVPSEAPLQARKLAPVPELIPAIPLPALETLPAPSGAPAAVLEEPYYPLRQLTLKPRLMPDMEAQMELQLQDVEPQALILRLFINEEGGVDKVVLEQARLSADSAALIQGRFSAIKFYPGEINGQAVKSQLKLEVKLENALPPLPGRRG